MFRIGEPPYLECSTRGDKRFSAFCAMVNGQSIEFQYQAAKILNDGSTNNHWKKAKGQKALNQYAVNELYILLWESYIDIHPELLTVLQEQTGLSDMFGSAKTICQAQVLWDIRCKSLAKPMHDWEF